MPFEHSKVCVSSCNGVCGSHGNSDVHGHDLSEKFGFRSVSQCECMFGNVTVHA